jgi:putative oxidoreductase
MKSQRLTESSRAGYELLIAGASSLKSPFLLSVRLYWGSQMFVAGSAHLSDVPAMVERFQDWGVPFPLFNVYLSGLTEIVCGLLLLVGFASPADYDSADRQLLRGLSHSEQGGTAECLQRS